MADFNSKIKVSFVDDFSQSAQAARKQLEGLSAAGANFNKAGRAIMGVGARLSDGLIAPLVAVGVAAYQAGENLNRGMANVQSLGLTQERVEKLKRGVQDVAIATRTSTDVMADGLYQVVSAFGDSADTLKILELNAKAAKAGVASVEESIALTSAITKGYGDTSIEAMEAAADLSLMVVKLGQTEFPQLAASMGRVVPLAVNLGVSQQELGGALATLTGVTGSAAEVTTQLRGTMQALLAPTAAMTDLMREQGFASGEAMERELGLAGSLLAIAKSAAASGKPLQAYMGSIEGQTAALTLTGAQLDNFTAKMEEIGNISGATQAAFLTQTEGINASGSAMDLLSVQLEVMMQRLSDGLAPAITTALGVVGPFIDKLGVLAARFAELEPAQQKNIVKILDIVAVAGPALKVLGGLSRGVGSIINVVGNVITLFAGLQGVLFGTTTAAGVATPGLFALAVAHWAVVWPILAIIAALAALVVGVVMVVRHWETIKAFFVGLWEGVKNIFRTAINWVMGILDNKLVQGALVIIAPFVGIPLAIIKNWDAIKNFFAKLWEGIKNIFSAGIDWVRGKLAKLPIIGGLFDNKKGGLFGDRRNPGAATVDSLAAGMTDALPAAEEASLRLARGVDDYLPHSDARKGPLSRLSESGSSLMETLKRGALRKRLDLSGPLALAPLGGKESAGSGSTIINIDNLTVQSEDAEDIFRFVRMLIVAGGAA